MASEMAAYILQGAARGIDKLSEQQQEAVMRAFQERQLERQLDAAEKRLLTQIENEKFLAKRRRMFEKEQNRLDREQKKEQFEKRQATIKAGQDINRESVGLRRQQVQNEIADKEQRQFDLTYNIISDEINRLMNMRQIELRGTGGGITGINVVDQDKLADIDNALRDVLDRRKRFLESELGQKYYKAEFVQPKVDLSILDDTSETPQIFKPKVEKPKVDLSWQKSLTTQQIIDYYNTMRRKAKKGDEQAKQILKQGAEYKLKEKKKIPDKIYFDKSFDTFTIKR